MGNCDKTQIAGDIVEKQSGNERVRKEQKMGAGEIDRGVVLPVHYNTYTLNT